VPRSLSTCLLDCGGQLTHQATAPPPSLHTPHPTRGIRQPLALQLDIPGPMELVEPHGHGHRRDEPEPRPRVVGQPREQPGQHELDRERSQDAGGTDPTTAASMALDAACRSSLTGRTRARRPPGWGPAAGRSREGRAASSAGAPPHHGTGRDQAGPAATRAAVALPGAGAGTRPGLGDRHFSRS
jgi:hypothetical protein